MDNQEIKKQSNPVLERWEIHSKAYMKRREEVEAKESL